MVKVATSFLAVAHLALPAFATFSEQLERSLTEADMHERNFAIEDVVVTREDLDELFGREFVSDVEKRSPFGIGALISGVKNVAKVAKKVKSVSKSTKGFRNGVRKGYHAAEKLHNGNGNNCRREFDDDEFGLREYQDDLEARQSVLLTAAIIASLRHGRKAHNLAQGNAPQDNQDVQPREIDEDVFGRGFDDEDLMTREFDELD